MFPLLRAASCEKQSTILYIRLLCHMYVLTHLDVNIWPLANIYYLICWNVGCAKSACDSCPVTQWRVSRDQWWSQQHPEQKQREWPECVAVRYFQFKKIWRNINNWVEKLNVCIGGNIPMVGLVAGGGPGHIRSHAPTPDTDTRGTWGEATNSRHVIFIPSLKCIVFNMNFIILFRFICY